MTTCPDDRPIEIASPHDFATTLAQAIHAIEAAGLTIFAKIDHAENARQVGLSMPPATVLVYGNAKGGTPLMLAAPGAALDLPLRVLVREAAPGAVIAFYPIAPVLLRAGIAEAQAHALDPAQMLLTKALQP
jgi:uncharacterized protein (DUF302 family)